MKPTVYVTARKRNDEWVFAVISPFGPCMADTNRIETAVLVAKKEADKRNLQEIPLYNAEKDEFEPFLRLEDGRWI